MRYSNDVDNLRNQLETRFTEGLKHRIRELDLIDTGKTLRITEAHIIILDDGVDFEITSTDYFKYLDGDYDIVNATLNDRSIDALFSDLLGEIMMDNLDND